MTECFVFSIMCIYLWYIVVLTWEKIENSCWKWSYMIWQLVLKSNLSVAAILYWPSSTTCIALQKTQVNTAHAVCCTVETSYHSKTKHWKLCVCNQVIVAIKSVPWVFCLMVKIFAAADKKLDSGGSSIAPRVCTAFLSHSPSGKHIQYIY